MHDSLDTSIAGSVAPGVRPAPGPPMHPWRDALQTNPLAFGAALGLTSGLVLEWAGYAEVAAWIWRLTLVACGLPLSWGTLRRLLRGHFAADVVAALAILTALVMDAPFAGAVIVLMQAGGAALEWYARRRAAFSLTSLLARAPHTAWRKTGAGAEEIPVAAVRVGDLLFVRPGDLIPVDGVLSSAQAEVDESALTGEPLARSKAAGAPLLSGSVNTGGAFEMCATHSSADSEYAQIVALVRRAQEGHAPITRLADRVAVWFAPLTIAFAGVAWVLTGNAEVILDVLVVATPCPLLLAPPIAMISGINRAATTGLIVKSGTALEQIAMVKAAVFDKTGTLTVGRPVVEHVLPFGSLSAARILQLAASVEQLSAHLLARTLVQTARDQGLPLVVPLHFAEVPGQGVSGEVAGQTVMVGARPFLQQRIGPVGLEEGVVRTHTHGDDTLAAFVAVDGKPVGVILCGDRLRPGVPQLMQRLRGLGVGRLVLLTGDRRDSALKIALASGIDKVEAELLPGDKVRMVQALQAHYGALVMVGDGVNDAPALAAATVGVALGAQGSGIAGEAADLVLLTDDVAAVGEAVAIGQRTLHITRQSIGLGVGLSLGLMVLAGAGLIPAPIGAVGHEVVDLLVILNALRALR